MMLVVIFETISLGGELPLEIFYQMRMIDSASCNYVYGIVFL